MKKNILVVGLTKNSSKTIKSEISVISKAFQHFSDVKWLVIESDSRDNTLLKLMELRDEVPQFCYLSLGSIADRYPLRTERIAYCRNSYLQEITNNALYEDVEYVVVADLDGMNVLLTQEGVTSCWANDDWDVCTANQQGPYYDIWALRHNDWSPNNCWDQYEFLLKHNMARKRARFVAVHSRMVDIDERSEWIEVDSAFGGFAIYRREALLGARYIGVNESGEEICEHLSLHQAIKSNGYRIFINPKLINTGFNRHTKRFVFRLLRRRAEDMIHALRQGFSINQTPG